MTVAGVDEGAASGCAPGLVRRLREDPNVAAAEAVWDAAGARLVVTVEAFVEGDASDIDEARNFDRVWRLALHCFPDRRPLLRFDIEGSIGLSADESGES